MAAIFSFKCSKCGQLHEGSPSFSFDAPAPYLEQSEEIRKNGNLGTDLCEYKDEHGEHYFIRAVLEIPIHGANEPFLWGAWVSLSEKSFMRYVETYDAPDPNDSFFGWFCNHLPGYEDTYALKAQVHPRKDGIRPYIELEATSHPLAVDYHNGLTVARAQEIAETVMHGAQGA